MYSDHERKKNQIKSIFIFRKTEVLNSEKFECENELRFLKINNMFKHQSLAIFLEQGIPFLGNTFYKRNFLVEYIQLTLIIFT